MSLKRYFKSFDFVLLILVSILCILGIILMGSISATRGEVSSKIYDKQKIFFIMGLCVLFVTSLIDYKFISKFYIPIYIFNILLLLSAFVLGSESNTTTNTARWINVFGFTLQPSEFSKIFLVVFLANYIDKKKDKINNIEVLIGILLLVAFPMIIIVLQPSLSAALVSIAILTSILFVAKLNYRYFAVVLCIVVPLISAFYYDVKHNNSFIFNKFSNLSGGVIKEYHISRFTSFVNKDPTDDKYKQTYNSLNAIGSGGFSGKGLTQGTVNKFGYIGNNENDFIISLLGEELGFIGCAAAILIMFLIICKCLLIAYKCNSSLGRLIIAGIVGMFIFQTFVNVAVATDILPNTGMPFPFLSSGGSSMLVNMFSIGLIINIGMDKPKSIFEG